MPGQPSPTRAIFINYRRDDTGGEAGRLYDDLTRAFDSNIVFMDVSGIEPGKDFRKSIDENVAQCGVLLAVIGRQWLTIPDAAGARRLDSPNDFVRLEIASALARNIPVIPVLVQGTAMPPAQALPEPLQDLAYRNAVELTLPRWNSDLALLIAALKNYLHVTHDTAPPPVHDTVPIQLPVREVPATSRAAHARIPIYAGAALFLIALAIYFFTRPSRPTAQYQVPLPFNAIGIFPDGATFSPYAFLPGQNSTFHPFDKLLQPGTDLLTAHDGTVFRIGPVAAKDVLVDDDDQPTVIPLPPERYGTLAIVGAAFPSSVPAASFYVDYTTRNALHSQGVSALTATADPRFPGENVLLTQNYFNRYDGTQVPVHNSLYTYRFKLDNTIPLKSLTLPQNHRILIFSVTLLP